MWIQKNKTAFHWFQAYNTFPFYFPTSIYKREIHWNTYTLIEIQKVVRK
jgi:hypothetical protein